MSFILMMILSLSVRSEIAGYVEEIAELYSIDPNLIQAMIETESSYDPEAESKCGAVGLMQIMECYHEDRMNRLGVEDLKDPYGNILTGTDYMAELIDRHGNIAKALMYYNMGGRGIELYDQGIISKYALKILKLSSSIRREKDERINYK